MVLHLVDVEREGVSGAFIIFGSRTVEIDSTLPLDLSIEQAFKEELQNLHPKLLLEEGEINRFFLHLNTGVRQPTSWTDLTRIEFWENSKGQVCFPSCYTTGHLNLEDLHRSYKAGYIPTRPKEIYCQRAWGLGGDGFSYEVLEWLVSNGAGWVLTLPLSLIPGKIRKEHLTQKARAVAKHFEAHRIYSSESIRRWAATQEEWTTALGAKKLGVEREVVESIFVALGYRKRHHDQTWRKGEMEVYLERHAAWIEGEPLGAKLEIPDRNHF